LQAYERIEYGSHILLTAASERNNLTADSYVRLDFHTRASSTARTKEGMAIVLKSCYGQIERLFTHSLYPGGPSHVVASVDWYDSKGTHALSKLPLVAKTTDDEDAFGRMTFVKECYPRPLAIWPNDPLDDLDPDDPAKEYFRVIDRNETS
jgi:hypothetical protein